MPLPNVQCEARIDLFLDLQCMYKKGHENPDNMIGSVTPLYVHRAEFMYNGKKTVIEWEI